MKPVFLIDGVDYTNFVLANKFGWTRNDLEADSAGRTLDLVMHRKRLGSKRVLKITCKTLSYEGLHSLVLALKPEYIRVTYLDPEFGIVTKTFYGTSVSSTTMGYLNGDTQYDGTSFELVER